MTKVSLSENDTNILSAIEITDIDSIKDTSKVITYRHPNDIVFLHQYIQSELIKFIIV